MTTLDAATIERNKNVPFNFVVNVLEGGFFGMALGFASFSTILPLFVSQLTDSAILIGLIPAVHTMGWQLPQMFLAHRVSQQRRYKPMVMFFTVHERIPFLGLAAVAWFIPTIGPKIALISTFFLLIWQGLGGGFTATAWQSMIGKIIPQERWGLFFGTQSAVSNMLASIGAVVAGIILERNDSIHGFTLCFLIAGIIFFIAYITIGLTREKAAPPVGVNTERKAFWRDMRDIWKRDTYFKKFIAARILGQLGTLGFAFYTVYVVRIYGVNEATAGIFTGVMMITQMVFNPIMGWLGDRWNHRSVMALGMLSAAVSATIAIWAPSVGWFYLAYIMAGVGYVGLWTISLAMTLEFGEGQEKPAYIGMANTLIAPTAFIIPLLGGWLADTAGYQATFLATALGALATAVMLGFVMRGKRDTMIVEG